MEQSQLEIFIKGVINYFHKLTGESVEIGVPYLMGQEENVLMGYTGMIGISGKLRGAIYITCREEFLAELLRKIRPDSPISEKLLSDLAGELTNTIAGNAQKVLGKDFHISVPLVLTAGMTDKSLEIKTPTTFILPFRWLAHQVSLVVGLMDNE
jgi:chemotaxis protein CheX